jgi:hypothetical protein
MHANDHSVAMHIITAIVKTMHKVENDLGLPKNTLVNKFYNCQSPRRLV